MGVLTKQGVVVKNMAGSKSKPTPPFHAGCPVCEALSVNKPRVVTYAEKRLDQEFGFKLQGSQVTTPEWPFPAGISQQYTCPTHCAREYSVFKQVFLA